MVQDVDGDASNRTAQTLEAWVSLDHGSRLRCHLGYVLLPHEEDEGALRVSPHEIAEELIQGPGEGFLARPELALGDEHRSLVLLDEDVGLAPTAEHLTSTSAELVVE